MSYTIKSTSPFVSIKLTDFGRKNLALGQLTFNYFSLGDSEINYVRENLLDDNLNTPEYSATTTTFRPFDKQSNFKSFITKDDGTFIFNLDSSSINVIKAVVNNKATERGFFSGGTYITQTGSTYNKSVLEVNNSTITGGTGLVVPSATTLNTGDFIRLKLKNTLASPSTTENILPLPNLFYKIQSTGQTGVNRTLTLDRALPNNSGQTGTTSVFIYPSGEVATSYGSEVSTAYWDSGTLSFDSATNITCDDVKVWNMNNIWCENLAGITGLTTTSLYEDYTKFGSYEYLGTMNPYLGYINKGIAATTPNQCNGVGNSYPDDVIKSISVIHYTNNTISNLYGEFFHIDTTKDKILSVYLPNLMYHKSNYSTASGLTQGMNFITDGILQNLDDTDIEYYNLYEDAEMMSQDAEIVGKVFPNMKMVVFDNDEIVAAMSYKSNRNWILPELSASLSAPTGGTSNGVLANGKTIYLTYTLNNESNSGLTQALPCQKYIKVTNTTPTTKDISFKISDIDRLPFMRKKELVDYDGLGFYATNFKLIYQIVDNFNDRPEPGSWKTFDFTSTSITTTTGQTVNPKLLENQTPTTNGFVLTQANYTASTTFDLISMLNMPANTQSNKLQFGDEKFLYGNLDTYIGANIYKTLFDIRVNTSEYTKTTNPTRTLDENEPDLRVSEVGIYDTNKNLVIIGKLSQPIELEVGVTALIELALDF